MQMMHAFSPQTETIFNVQTDYYTNSNRILSAPAVPHDFPAQ